ncbi:TRAP transporter small permease [Pontibacillus marinus]|uniref:C4-dicarboxylate ABC transporter permease n=1 Tax=Pontibacillus marinus BH030004 = DSM 16465 TaxID=1385511 RepID=A0A0A5GIC0_9BACI|nr:TRAP transporter small permease [Pontibacillus marinus]KGX91764.1 C4-dicarboxylate ABC transporter permease [Pontibacillus marinus BH030004 = DSM 16465]
MMRAIIKSIDGLNKVLGVLLAVLLMVMSAVVFYQVFSRFVLDESLRWSEELARYIMIWAVFIGSALAIRKMELISVDAIKELMPEKAIKVLNILVYLASIVFLAVLVQYGFEMVSNVSTQTSPAMRIPMAWAYAAIPVGSIFMIINCIAIVIENIMNFKGGEQT